MGGAGNSTCHTGLFPEVYIGWRLWNGMLNEGESHEEEECQQGGEICFRFSSNRRLHSIPDALLLPLVVRAEATPSCEIRVTLSAAGDLVCFGTFGSFYVLIPLC